MRLFCGENVFLIDITNLIGNFHEHIVRKHVTIIERESQIMSQQFSPNMIDVVEEAIRESGGYIIHTNNGDVEADVVVLSLGFMVRIEIPNHQV